MESLKSPVKKKRLKDCLEQAEPFTMPPETLKSATAWMDESTLEQENIRLYQGSFRDEAGHVTEVPMIPQELCQYARKHRIMRILEKLDLHHFFEAQLPAIDCRRVYELITSVKEDGTAEITNLEGEKTAVNITIQTVVGALGLSAQGDMVTKRREELKVYKSKKKNYTYNDPQDNFDRFGSVSATRHFGFCIFFS